ncbi:MAG TPA: hypothetical protein PK673_07715 [Paludibacteraceae bacterium]|nr:hypothetical protein [Paludibacteraceae bacterium]
MSYNSKKNIVSMVAGLLTVTAYIVYVCAGNAPTTDDIVAWARLMLVFIGIGVGAVIVIQILFHVAFAIGVAVKERDKDGAKTEKLVASSMVEDERDKLISLKSSHIGYIAAGIGVVAALIALASGVSFVVSLHVIFGSFAVGSLVEGIAGIILHERGVRNG